MRPPAGLAPRSGRLGQRLRRNARYFAELRAGLRRGMIISADSPRRRESSGNEPSHGVVHVDTTGTASKAGARSTMITGKPSSRAAASLGATPPLSFVTTTSIERDRSSASSPSSVNGPRSSTSSLRAGTRPAGGSTVRTKTTTGRTRTTPGSAGRWSGTPAGRQRAGKRPTPTTVRVSSDPRIRLTANSSTIRRRQNSSSASSSIGRLTMSPGRAAACLYRLSSLRRAPASPAHWGRCVSPDTRRHAAALTPAD